MRKLMLAVGLLVGLGALVQAADAHKPATISFGKGTTVTVNGQSVASGYELKKGDKVKVAGGDATVTGRDGTYSARLRDGDTMDVPVNGDIKTVGGQQLVAVSTSWGNRYFYATDFASPPPPPNPSQNQAVVPTVSSSAP